MDLNNDMVFPGDIDNMMLQFVYKGDYTLAVQLYHNHVFYGVSISNILLIGFCWLSFYSFQRFGHYQPFRKCWCIVLILCIGYISKYAASDIILSIR